MARYSVAELNSVLMLSEFSPVFVREVFHHCEECMRETVLSRKDLF
jgi:hypothetical protein